MMSPVALAQAALVFLHALSPSVLNPRGWVPLIALIGQCCCRTPVRPSGRPGLSGQLGAWMALRPAASVLRAACPPHVAPGGTLLSRHWHSQPHLCPLALFWCGLGVLVSWMTCITCMAGEGVVSPICRLHSRVLVSLLCQHMLPRGGRPCVCVCLHVSCWLSLTRLSYGSMCAVTQPLKVLLCTGRCVVHAAAMHRARRTCLLEKSMT